MTDSPTLAITGSTGALGGIVARDLAGRGVPQRLLVRDLARAPRLEGATVHRSSYSDSAASTEALEGVTTLFMVSASEDEHRVDQHKNFVDAAAAAGVQHIVYTSFLAAAADSVFTLGRDHYATEEHIRASGMRWTFLRDNFYMDVLDEFGGDEGVIRGPAGEGRCSFVSRADIARVATAVLLDPATHADRTYDMTGPEALSFDEVAATISRLEERTVRFQNETLDEAYESRAKYGAPDWEVEAWVSTYTAIASGDLAGVSDDIETVTGTAPQTFEQYLSTPRD